MGSRVYRSLLITTQHFPVEEFPENYTLSSLHGVNAHCLPTTLVTVALHSHQLQTMPNTKSLYFPPATFHIVRSWNGSLRANEWYRFRFWSVYFLEPYYNNLCVTLLHSSLCLFVCQLITPQQSLWFNSSVNTWSPGFVNRLTFPICWSFYIIFAWPNYR